MKRLRRIILNSFTFLSLLLCVATIVAWVGSSGWIERWRIEKWTTLGQNLIVQHQLDLESHDGRLRIGIARFEHHALASTRHYPSLPLESAFPTDGIYTSHGFGPYVSFNQWPAGFKIEWGPQVQQNSEYRLEQRHVQVARLVRGCIGCIAARQPAIDAL